MLEDNMIVVAANAIDTAITHMRVHSGARGAAGTTNQIGSLVAVNGTVDGDGDITWTNVAFTGLPANSPVVQISLWASGVYAGGGVLSGDATANSAGEYTVTNWSENSTAS